MLLSKAKTQKGPPFISDPAVLVFRDFVVGETMNIPFTLTNVSFSRNTYKVIGVDKEYETLFKINSKPPGYVSPGVSVELSLNFTPKFNSQIKCSLHFLAQTGPFDVEIECLPKVVNIQIEPFDVLNIGNVTLGEEIERNLTIRNYGALSALWAISLGSTKVDPGFLTLEEAEDGIIRFSPRHGIVNGYGKSTLKVVFRPKKPCQLKFTINIKISSSHKEFEPFVCSLPLEGVGVDVPVFLESNQIDFGVCLYNELYRSTIIAHNRSNITHRFIVNLPPNLEKYVEFVPKLGFIRSQSSLQIGVKLRLTKKFKQHFPRIEQTASFPISLEIANQVLPVPLNLTFTPSSSRLTFEPSVIDFGTFITTESKEVPLKIKSHLKILCNFGFIGLPSGVSVQPFDGFGLILPGETVEVNVSFQAPVPKKYEFQISLATLNGQKFNIPCLANITQSPLLMSESSILFEATPLGTESSYSVTLTNQKNQPLEFEFGKFDDFLFDPVVSTIPPNSSKNVFITFKPTVPLRVADSGTDSDVSPLSRSSSKSVIRKKLRDRKKEDKEEAHEPKQQIDPEFTYKTYEKSVSCFWRCNGSNGSNHLLLKGASILPQLFVTEVLVGGKETKSEDFIDLSLSKINFGVVATGQSLDAIVTIKSVVKRRLPLEFIFEHGSFDVLTPSTELKPLQGTPIRIRFTPTANVKFTSKVVIQCADKPNIRCVLTLIGEGASPSIILNQEVLDFGHVVVGQSITKSIQIKNNAEFSFEYVYELRPTPQMHHTNMDDKETFTIDKKCQRLNPSETGNVVVVFSPDHDNLSFQSVLVISAGENGEKREVPIYGSSWPYVMFIMGGNEEPQHRTAFDHYQLDEPYFRPNVICEMSYPGITSSVMLTFGVANQSDDVRKANGELFFDSITVPGFTVSPSKCAIECGGLAHVKVEYSPTASSLLQVGQWVVAETAVNLKCGEFMKKVPVKMKCLINMQQSSDLSAQTTSRQSKASVKRKGKK